MFFSNCTALVLIWHEEVTVEVATQSFEQCVRQAFVGKTTHELTRCAKVGYCLCSVQHRRPSLPSRDEFLEVLGREDAAILEVPHEDRAFNQGMSNSSG